MATGSGKTIAALVAAHQLYTQNQSLLIVIAAPYLPLVNQWCEEVSAFGIRPVNLTTASGVSARHELITKSLRRLRHQLSDIEVLIVTHDTLCTLDFVDALAKDNLSKLLIADEVHNLGRKNFIERPPSLL